MKLSPFMASLVSIAMSCAIKPPYPAFKFEPVGLWDAPSAHPLASHWVLMRFVLVTFIVLLASAKSFGAEIDMKADCKSNPQLIAACFTVHGRLSAYNGTPSLRIWPIGTRRLLGILADEDLLAIPENIRNEVGFGKDIYGDFSVCPFTESKPGQMQFVCVEAMSNVRVQNRP